MGKMRNAYSVPDVKSERKRSLGRPRHRWESNIKKDLMGIACENIDWIHVRVQV
jgi:hypothetical protein